MYVRFTAHVALLSRSQSHLLSSTMPHSNTELLSSHSPCRRSPLAIEVSCKRSVLAIVETFQRSHLQHSLNLIHLNLVVAITAASHHPLVPTFITHSLTFCSTTTSPFLSHTKSLASLWVALFTPACLSGIYCCRQLVNLHVTMIIHCCHC